MRREDEFATWLAARWPSLVRALVFLGHPQPVAEAAAREAAARVLPAWGREHRHGDVDLMAYGALLAEHHRLLRRRGEDTDQVPTGPAGPDEADLPPGLGEARERRRELEAHLATLSPPERTRAVLVHVAGLAPADAADLVEETAAPGPPAAAPVLPLTGPEVRDACEAVPVTPAPVAAVVDRSRRRRRTAWVRGAAVVAVVTVVLTATTWWTSGEGEGPTPGEVSRARNALPIPWYADRTLHLAEVEVRVPSVETLLRVPDGVVYRDADGRVVHVDEGGRQRPIGEAVPGSPMAAEPDNGWVAWTDPGDGVPSLVVHDTLAREEVGRRSLTAAGSGGEPVGDDGPISVVDERVYYSSPDGDFAWQPVIDVSYALSGTLVDTTGDARVTRTDGVVRVTPLSYDTGTPIGGDRARLTHDGRYAFATDDSDAFGRLTVYDVRTGSPVQLFSPSDEAVAWSYQDGVFWFAVLHMLQDKQYQDMLQMPSEGAYRIYRCLPGRADPCTKVTEVPEEVPDPPVFPQ